MEPGISPGEQPPEPGNTQDSKDKDFPCGKCGYLRTATACRECEERIDRVHQRRAILAAVWGGARARDQFTLEAYRPTAHNQNAIQVAKDFKPLEGDNLYIQGATGAGKTHLAVAAARIHTKARIKLLWKPQEISRAFRAAEDASGEVRKLQTFVGQSILIIDDLGVEKLTEFLVSLLYEIIDGRDMEGIGGLVVTSNLSLDQMAERLGNDRIPSRLAGMCRIVDLGMDPGTTPDMRVDLRGRPK